MIYWLTIALIMAVIIAFCSIGALLISMKNNDDLRAENEVLSRRDNVGKKHLDEVV
jgi:hypothetical protein